VNRFTQELAVAMVGYGEIWPWLRQAGELAAAQRARGWRGRFIQARGAERTRDQVLEQLLEPATRIETAFGRRPPPLRSFPPCG
jgi:hypothetical protein